jgi:hypothetical protein
MVTLVNKQGQCCAFFLLIFTRIYIALKAILVIEYSVGKLLC